MPLAQNTGWHLEQGLTSLYFKGNIEVSKVLKTKFYIHY